MSSEIAARNHETDCTSYMTKAYMIASESLAGLMRREALFKSASIHGLGVHTTFEE